jgi:hypothetical protein
MVLTCTGSRPRKCVCNVMPCHVLHCGFVYSTVGGYINRLITACMHSHVMQHHKTPGMPVESTVKETAILSLTLHYTNYSIT